MLTNEALIPVATIVALTLAGFIFWQARRNTREVEARPRNKVQFYIGCTGCKRETHQSALRNSLCPDCAITSPSCREWVVERYR